MKEKFGGMYSTHKEVKKRKCYSLKLKEKQDLRDNR
jgi:hypothetical protein